MNWAWFCLTGWTNRLVGTILARYIFLRSYSELNIMPTKTKLSFESKGSLHPTKEVESMTGDGKMYWKLKTMEGTFIIFSEGIAEQVIEMVKGCLPIWVSGEVRVCLGGTFLVVKRLVKKKKEKK